MGKRDLFPISRRVAALAVLLVMVWRGGIAVACGAVGVALMVEAGGCPTNCPVAAAAFPFIMGEGRGSLVAGCAIRIASMIKVEDVPILNVGVAADAGAFIMLCWRILNVAALTF